MRLPAKIQELDDVGPRFTCSRQRVRRRRRRQFHGCFTHQALLWTTCLDKDDKGGAGGGEDCGVPYLTACMAYSRNHISSGRPIKEDIVLLALSAELFHSLTAKSPPPRRLPCFFYIFSSSMHPCSLHLHLLLLYPLLGLPSAWLPLLICWMVVCTMSLFSN